jgi:hypothetical protein
MDLSKYVTQLREDLASAAAAGDEQTRNTAALLGSAIEPAARLALMSALSDLAAEVTAALEDREVEVRLDGRDVRVAVSGLRADPDADQAPDDEPEYGRKGGSGPGRFGGPGGFGGFGGFGGADPGDISRITLRLVDQIKSQAEQAAAARGQSLNSWVAQAVQEALSGNDPRRRRHQGPDRQDRQDRRDRRDRGGDDRDGRRLRGWVEG